MTQATRAYGWCFLLGGACFFARSLCAFIAGPPPSTGQEILVWIEAAKGMVMVGNETLVIGAGLLLAGSHGVQLRLRCSSSVLATMGARLMAAACVVCLLLGIVQGRFVYPIHGLSLTRPEDAELLAAHYFGGYHLVALVFAAATALWALAMRALPTWRALGSGGLVVAAGSVVSSYPDLVGPVGVFLLEGGLALWWTAVGFRVRLLKLRSSPAPPPEQMPQD